MSALGAAALVPTPTEGLVYVCVERGGRYAKIGWASSIDHAHARRSSHQTGNPRQLDLLIVGPGSLAAEAALHEALRDQAVRGEWFHVEGAVAETIARSHQPPARGGAGGGGRPGRPRTERGAAQAWLTAQLIEGPLPAGEVLQRAALDGHSLKTVRRAADELGVVREPPGGGRHCTWRLS